VQIKELSHSVLGLDLVDLQFDTSFSNMLPLSSGCPNYIQVDAEVIREEELF
jgi:hypothetical protein